MWGAGRFFNREESPKESRLVDFPEFREGNQDPIEWLESFDKACSANRVNEARKLILAGSYLKELHSPGTTNIILDTGTIHNTPLYLLLISSKTNFAIHLKFRNGSISCETENKDLERLLRNMPLPYMNYGKGLIP